MSGNIQGQYGKLQERVGEKSLFVDKHIWKGGYHMPYFHYHTSYELFYVKSGTADFIIDNKSYTIKDSGMLVIPPYVPHRSMYAETAETHRIEIQIKSELLNANMHGILESLSKNICYTLSLKYHESVTRLLNRLNDELYSGKAYSEDMCQAYISELLVTMYRHAVCCSESNEGDESLPQKIMEYISENYACKITIPEIAETFNVCESYVYKTFKRHTGLKITDYVNFTRVMNAERLIRETCLSLTEIAYRCGFNDYNYFFSVFKKYKSMTPGKLMKKYRAPMEEGSGKESAPQ